VAAASAVTRTIGLGVGVLLLPLRPLAWIGKHVSSLQVLSGDRILLGVGVGGEHAPEYAAAGVPTRERGRRTDRALEALSDLLQGRSAYDATLGAEIPPLLPHGAMPPVWVGGRSDPALRRAARFGDGWWGIWMDPGRVARAREQLTALAAEFDRPVPRIGTTVFVNVNARAETAREQSRAWLESQYGIEFAWVQKRVAYGPPSQVAERLAELREAGIEDFGLIVAAPDPREQFETLAGLRDQLSL
jgi:alkanesulfonate monooxygenase SsuD/methylene tetrahydromethanopterin reductase-like flavin-dependent oxidoreductase (luciferase family)